MQEKSSGLLIMSAIAQTDKQLGGEPYNHSGPPWYSLPLTARSGLNPQGSKYHSSNAGLQTTENPWGLNLYLHAHWSENNFPRPSAVFCRCCWSATWALNICNVSHGWDPEGEISVIVDTDTPVWSSDRTPQTKILTTSPLIRMSWTLW